MKFIIALAILTALVALYVVWIRPWLRQKPWTQGFFAHPWVEWMEIKFWSKSETILWARYQQFLGLVLIATGYMGGIDYSIFAPVVPESVLPFLPMIPLVLNFLGSIAEAQRRDTTKPLELVEIASDAPIEVKVAAEQAVSSTEQAVAAVKADEVKTEASAPVDKKAE